MSYFEVKLHPLQNFPIFHIITQQEFHLIKLTINKCLFNYFVDEIIDGEWICSKCKQTSKKIKRGIKITSTPNILILNSKRFQSYLQKKKVKYQSQQIWNSILRSINFSNNSFCCYTTDIIDTKYYFSVMIVHSGTIHEGHFTVMKSNQQFFLFNYDEIERISNDLISHIDSAYLLYLSQKI